MLREQLRSPRTTPAAVNTSIISKYVPHGFTKTKKDIPWLTPDLKRTCRKKRRLYNRAKKSQKPHHWESYKRCSSKCKKDLRRAHWQHLNTILLISETEKNPKTFWSYLKSQKQDSTGVAPLKYKNLLFSGAIDRAAILSRQFNKDADPETKNISPNGPNYTDIPPFHSN